jgi:Tol biopolymer transport system component
LEHANAGLFFFDLRSGNHVQHPNQSIEHLFNPCWSPDGRWIVTSVNGGKLGFGFAIVAIEASGNKVFNLGLTGCRPDFSTDGRKIAWGSSDYVLKIANWDLTSKEPRITEAHEIVADSPQSEIYVYYVDWSPDGKYVLFSRGPSHKGKYPLNVHPAFPGEIAEGWQICVADAKGFNQWVALTSVQAKRSDKEPDWVPQRVEGRSLNQLR